MFSLVIFAVGGKVEWYANFHGKKGRTHVQLSRKNRPDLFNAKSNQGTTGVFQEHYKAL